MYNVERQTIVHLHVVVELGRTQYNQTYAIQMLTGYGCTMFTGMDSQPNYYQTWDETPTD